ncbi:MAG: hypothetical protein V4531_07720 [Actinomycetota bacterium]
MKHPLLLVALCATAVVSAVSGTAAAAFALPAASQSAEVRNVAPLTVPINHRPAADVATGTPSSKVDRRLVVVPVAGAETLVASPAAAVESPLVPELHSPAGSTSDDHAGNGPVPASGAGGVTSADDTKAESESGKSAEVDKPAKAVEAPKPPTSKEKSGGDDSDQSSSTPSGDGGQSGKKD